MEAATTTLVDAPPATAKTAFANYLRAFGEEQRAMTMLRLGIGSERAVASARERRRIAEDQLEDERGRS